jgi:ABC-type dipeptide/oligopeptide/nickel transport system permease component
VIARVIQRLLASLLVVFGAVTAVFLILNWLPGNAAESIAGEEASEQTIVALSARLGTDRGLWEQYHRYLAGLVHGDLGRSYVTGEPVLRHVASQWPATLQLTLVSSLVAVTLGTGLGVLSARFAGRWFDQLIQATVLLFASMPTFWLGILLMLVFSVQLGWLPVIGNGSVAQAILPVACLGLIGSAPLARLMREGMVDGLNDPYVTTLRAKGLLPARVFYVHVLRNALIPVITYLGVLVGELLSNAVVVETLFARQGIGRLTVEAIGQKDLPVVQGSILFIAVSFVLINLLVDLSYTVIDPRVRAQ